MSFRTPALWALFPVALMAGHPAWAQAPDFGTDSSAWANDGECDDPRFTGPGMASTTLEIDRMADATDCRNAFRAGTVQLIGGQAAAPTAPAQPPTPAAPGVTTQATPSAQPAAPAAAPQVPANPNADPKSAQVTPPAPAAEPAVPPAMSVALDFGDDSSQWARDRECDDRRFVGQGMAATLSWANVGRDATDCRALHETGQIRIWTWTEAQAATQCTAIDFGTDAGGYANDGECDDIRFEGMGAAFGMSPETTGQDATDCSRLCGLGTVALRDY